MSPSNSRPETKPKKLQNSMIVEAFDVQGMVKAARARASHPPQKPLALEEVREIHIFFLYFGQLLEADNARPFRLDFGAVQLPTIETPSQSVETGGQAEGDEEDSLTIQEVKDLCAEGERQWPAVAAAILANFALDTTERSEVLIEHEALVPELIRDSKNGQVRGVSDRDKSPHEHAAPVTEWGSQYLMLLAGGPIGLERSAATIALANARSRWAQWSMKTLARWEAGKQLPYGLLLLHEHESTARIAAAVDAGLQWKALSLARTPELGWSMEGRMVVLRAAVEHAFDSWRTECPPLREMASASFHLPIAAAYASLDDESLLILGPSGTGKELMAKAVHALSTRRESILLCVNLASLPDSLAATELFGHLKGAFTGANTVRKGLWREADGGTLFLDEIDKASRDVQAMLLRVLMDGMVRAVGESGSGTKVDVRVIAATSAPITQLHGNDYILPDLAFRFQQRINLPALTERSDRDWQALWSSLTQKAARKFEIDEPRSRTFGTIAPESLDKLRRRPGGWPGNIRELEDFALEYVKCNRYRVSGRLPLDKFIDLSVPGNDSGAGLWPDAALAHGERMLTAGVGLDAVVRDYRETLVKDVIVRHGKDAAPKVLGMKLDAFKKMLTRAKSARTAPAGRAEREQH